jgi:hypothetical protein
MGTQYKANEQKQATNRVSIIGNISPKSIEINEEKGYARYSVAVSPGKDQAPQWYNVIQSTKDEKTLATLKELQSAEKGKQVKLSATINYSKVEKEGEETKYYSNLSAYYIEPTKDFQLPKATIELTGTVSKALTTKEVENINPETGEITNKKSGYLGIKTMEGNDKDPWMVKYHNLFTSNEKNMEFLSQVKEGEQINVKARLRGDGSINIAKDSTIAIGKDFAIKNTEQTKSQDKDR